MKDTSFKDAVYAVVSRIPKGSVMTYKEVAIQIGRPQAFRAVATVLAKNYNPDIPCHRVIRSDGGVGGYNRGGVDTKRSILESEGATL